MAVVEKTVAVLGGGIAGLTAAHELRDRGYRVTVFDAAGPEAKHLGGKARSYEVGPDDPEYPYGQFSGLEPGEQTPMFGEHGFRFFPGFYQHVIETMKSIPVDGGKRVYDLLEDLDASTFYVRQIDEPPITPGLVARAAGRAMDGLKRCGLLLFLIWALVGGWLAWYHDASRPFRIAWVLAPLVWFVARTSLFSRTPRGKNSLCVPLQVGSPDTRTRSRLIQHHRRWKYLALTSVVPLFVLEHPWRASPFIIGIAVVVWWYPMFATIRYLWTNLLQKIPPGVRPGILESVAASIKVGAVIAAAPDRRYRQWERESWWSFISAYRYSRPFQLAFATGLTRSFVATRAERMSARTGATILGQLLFDLAPTVTGRPPSDRVLSLPTHDAWIRPWVTYLGHDCPAKPAVRFNQFDGDRQQRARVEVWRLQIEGRPTGTLTWDPDHPPTITGFTFKEDPDAEPQNAPHRFDHYVLAVSGTSAQEILMRSGEVIAWDRAYAHVPELGDQTYSREFERNLPYLDGIFELEFGWMTGMVFHLKEPSGLPQGHLLCLESEWALTAIDYGDIWRKAASANGGSVPALCTTPWQSIVSVNVSDWFASSPLATPANFGDLQRVRAETWRQLAEHLPELHDIEQPPPFIPDRAVSDMASRPDLAPQAKQPLTNSERLLVNVAGSWHHRPSAQTAFGNLVVAGDYVRTATDFASMEAANEAAKRAVNVILARDHRKPGSGSDVVHPPLPGHVSYCTLYELPVPEELKWPIKLVAAIDRPCMKYGLPHPLMLIATPIGWFAGLEAWLRYRCTPPTMAGGRPCERTHPGRHGKRPHRT